jgi:hypothetical protein
VAALSCEPKGARGRFSEAFGGSVNRLINVRLCLFDPDAVPVIQAECQAAAFIGAAARPIHVDDANTYPFNTRTKAAKGKVQAPLKVGAKISIPFNISAAKVDSHLKSSRVVRLTS